MYEELRAATLDWKTANGLSNARIAEMLSRPKHPVSKQSVGQWLSGASVLSPRVIDRLGELLEDAGWTMIEGPKTRGGK